MSIKYQGNRRDEQWRERQRQKQHEHQEVEKKDVEEVKEHAGTEPQEEPESQSGEVEAVEAIEKGNPTESDITTEPPKG